MTSSDTPGFSPVFRSAQTRAKVVTILLAVMAVVLALTFLQDSSGFALADRFERGLATDEEALAYDAVTGLLGLVYLGALFATAIAYLAWLSRTVDNIPALTGQKPSVTPRWAIGWWFVPLANLFKPYQIVRETNDLLATPSRSGGGPLIIVWWLFWVMANLLGVVLWRMPAPETIEQFRTWISVNAAFDAVDLVGAGLAILVVRQIQARADERAGQLPATSPQAALPA